MFVAHARRKRNEGHVVKVLRQQARLVGDGNVLAKLALADVVHVGEGLATAPSPLAGGGVGARNAIGHDGSS
jgi:hypothetical protein